MDNVNDPECNMYKRASQCQYQNAGQKILRMVERSSWHRTKLHERKVGDSGVTEGGQANLSVIAGKRDFRGLPGAFEREWFRDWESVKLPNHLVHRLTLLDEGLSTSHWPWATPHSLCLFFSNDSSHCIVCSLVAHSVAEFSSSITWNCHSSTSKWMI